MASLGCSLICRGRCGVWRQPHCGPGALLAAAGRVTFHCACPRWAASSELLCSLSGSLGDACRAGCLGTTVLQSLLPPNELSGGDEASSILWLHAGPVATGESPAPAPSSIEGGDFSGLQVPLEDSPGPAPAPSAAEEAPAPAPSPSAAVEAPAPAPSAVEEAPAPAPSPSAAVEAPAPAPSPSAAVEAPGPAPSAAEEAPTPAPSPSAAAEAPAPAPSAVEEAPVPAPSPSAAVEAPAPAPSPSAAVEVPAPAPSAAAEAPAPAPSPSAAVEAPAPAPSPGVFPGPFWPYQPFLVLPAECSMPYRKVLHHAKRSDVNPCCTCTPDLPAPLLRCCRCCPACAAADDSLANDDFGTPAPAPAAEGTEAPAPAPAAEGTEAPAPAPAEGGTVAPAPAPCELKLRCPSAPVPHACRLRSASAGCSQPSQLPLGPVGISVGRC